MNTAATLALALLATCSPPDTPDRPLQPPDAEEPAEDQHFCCSDVRANSDATVGHGDGCVIVAEGHIGTCNAVLYCPKGYSMNDGHVTCPL